MKSISVNLKRWIERHPHLSYYIVYFFLFSILSLWIFAPFIIKGNSFISQGDGFNTYYPTLVYIGRYIRNFVTELSLKQFDFSLGFGEGIIPALSFAGFGNPFTILAAFFSPRGTVYIFTVIQLLQLFCSGITFSLYSFSHARKPIYTLIGAFSYVFTTYSLIQGVQFMGFIYPMITLPLLAIGLDQILNINQNRKVSFIFIIAVFLQAITGFYFLYMETVFILFYFFVRYFCNYKRSLFSFIQMGSLIASQYLLGVMMSSVLLLPTLFGFFNSTRTGSTAMTLIDLLIYGNRETYLLYYENLLIPHGYGISIGIPMLGILSICVIFNCRNKYQELKIGVLLLGIGCLIPAVSFMMNGFSYVSNRWFFILFFIMAYIMVAAFEDIGNLSKRSLIIGTVVMLLSICANFIIPVYKEETVFHYIPYLIMLMLLLLVFVLRSSYPQMFSKCLVIFCLINICLNGFAINGPRSIGGTGLSANFMKGDEPYKQIENCLAGTIEDQSDFYRIDAYDSAMSASQVLNYYGTTAYFSIINKNISDFFRILCISPGYRDSFALKGLDGRAALESLLSVKYYQTSDSVMKENSEYIPLGFTYDKYFLRDELNELNAIERANVMLEAIVLESEIEEVPIIHHFYTNKGKELSYSIDFHNIDCDENSWTVKDAAEIVLQVPDYDSTQELYININGFSIQNPTSVDIQAGGKEILVSNTIGFPSDYWIHIDNENLQAKEVHLTFSNSCKMTVEDIKVYQCPVSHISSQVDILKDDKMRNTTIHNNGITGDYYLESNKLAFFSIPYSSGWTAWIDGQEVEIYKANVAFMSVLIPRGEHSIELKYRTPGITAGFALSSVGILIFAGLIIYLTVNKRKIRESEK